MYPIISDFFEPRLSKTKVSTFPFGGIVHIFIVFLTDLRPYTGVTLVEGDLPSFLM